MALAVPRGSSAVACRAFGAASGFVLEASRRLDLRRQRLRQAFEVEDPADQVRFLPDPRQAPPAEAPEPVPVLALAEELLNLLPCALRELIAEAPHPHADARMRALAPAAIGRNVRGDAVRQQRLDEPRGEVSFVAPQRGGREAPPALRP